MSEAVTVTTTAEEPKDHVAGRNGGCHISRHAVAGVPSTALLTTGRDARRYHGSKTPETMTRLTRAGLERVELRFSTARLLSHSGASTVSGVCTSGYVNFLRADSRCIVTNRSSRILSRSHRTHRRSTASNWARAGLLYRLKMILGTRVHVCR